MLLISENQNLHCPYQNNQMVKVLVHNLYWELWIFKLTSRENWKEQCVIFIASAGYKKSSTKAKCRPKVFVIVTIWKEMKPDCHFSFKLWQQRKKIVACHLVFFNYFLVAGWYIVCLQGGLAHSLILLWRWPHKQTNKQTNKQIE